MIRVRPARERGFADHGWLRTHHSFSFADYRDPRHMGFRTLRVLNDDVVAPGGGFGAHPHRDMEIVSYVVEGALAHEDSTGAGGIIRPGDVQHMSAGRGVVHSEFNASTTEPLRFLQVWILPAERGTDPSYAQRHFPPTERQGRLRLVVSPDGRDGSLGIGQDATIHTALLAPGDRVVHRLGAGRGAWVQVVRGEVVLAEHGLAEGDGAAVEQVDTVELCARADSELVVIDLGGEARTP
jgi:hypothetical protein